MIVNSIVLRGIIYLRDICGSMCISAKCEPLENLNTTYPWSYPGNVRFNNISICIVSTTSISLSGSINCKHLIFIFTADITELHFLSLRSCWGLRFEMCLITRVSSITIFSLPKLLSWNRLVVLTESRTILSLKLLLFIISNRSILLESIFWKIVIVLRVLCLKVDHAFGLYFRNCPLAATRKIFKVIARNMTRIIQDSIVLLILLIWICNDNAITLQGIAFEAIPYDQWYFSFTNGWQYRG